MIISTGERKNNHFKTNFRYYISPQEEQANNCIKNTRQFYDEKMHAQSFLLTNNRMGFFPPFGRTEVRYRFLSEIHACIFSPYEICSHLSYTENCLELIDQYNISNWSIDLYNRKQEWYDRWSNQSSSANAIGRRDHIETDCWPIKQSGDDGLQHSQSLKLRLLNYCFRRQQPTTALLRVTFVRWLALYRSVFWNYTIRWKKSGLGLGRPLFALAVDVASDEESGLQYLRLRHYEEKTFRFRLDIFQFLSVVNDHHEIFSTASESDDARIVKRAYHFQWLML